MTRNPVTWMPIQSVRARLWSALALLSLAVIAICAASWLSLARVDARLQAFHGQTLTQVAQALELSKRSTDLATSAPYLLNQKSHHLINSEGEKLLVALEAVRTDWPATSFGDDASNHQAVAEAISRMATGVGDLIAASSTLETLQSALRALIAALGDLRATVSFRINDPNIAISEHLTWWRLQSMTSDALNASLANNLIGVGEEQRHFLAEHREMFGQSMTPEQSGVLAQLGTITGGAAGVFELRRQELTSVLTAQNALFRIRHDAGLVSTVASEFAVAAEQFLAVERRSSSAAIQVTKVAIAAIAVASLLLALWSAVYVSRYVTFNIGRISAAMVQLAEGDRTSSLPRRFPSQDEIGDLFRSFRSFRANALRLDRSNRQLDQRNTLFQKVFTNISDGIAITDVAGRITAQNPAMKSILGVPDDPQISTKFITQLMTSQFGAVARDLGLGANHRGYCELTGIDGQQIELRASHLPDDGRVWLCSDVTERRKLADRLQQIDRIETLGKVAGDTAHDFGNILSTIGTHTHLLRHMSTDTEKATLAAIDNAIEYGSHLTQRLLAFAKKQHLAPEEVDLNLLVAGMIDLVEISLKPDVALQVTYADEPAHVLVDPGQMESTLLNLVLNANQAIAAVGTICITVGLAKGGPATLVVQDNGVGIPPEILERVIDPFFTTRSHEGGTGLGLSIAYGFVKQTGGEFVISSTFGQGTRVALTIPPAPNIPTFDLAVAGQRVLLVEDEKSARDHAEALLHAMGIVVRTANDGQTALAALQEDDFDLVVTDLDLGSSVSGWQVADCFRAKNHQGRVILLSGHLPEVLPTLCGPSDQVCYLAKPTGFHELHEAVAKLVAMKEIQAETTGISVDC